MPTSGDPAAFAIDLPAVQAAAARIAGRCLITPTVYSEALSQELDCQLSFKAECLQHIGAFKARGATNAVFALDESIASQGVVTHSSGNHAAALARAASLRGIPAHVVMPHNSIAFKLEQVRSFGLEPVLCEPDADSRAAVCAQLQERTGATFVHPYNNPLVMAGQGTVGLEILDQVPEVEVVVVPVGGGGLLSGILTAIKSQRPEVQVIAAEPEWADDAARSLQSGHIEMPLRYDTVADGLRTPLGDLTFPIIRELVDDIILVSEDDIMEAVRALHQKVNLVAEPSGAVSLAAIRKEPGRFAGKRVVAVVSGGNVSPAS